MADHDHDKSGPGKSLDSLLGIFSAVSEGLLPQVDAIVQRDPCSVKRLDEEAASPLHVAALHGHTDVLQLLLRSGAHVNEHTCGCLPLHLACARGHAECVRLLLAAGSWVGPREASTANQDTPLHKAARHGHDETVDILLEAGAAPAALNARGETPGAVATRQVTQQLLTARSEAQHLSTAAESSQQHAAGEPLQLPPPVAAAPALADVQLKSAAFESAAGKAAGAAADAAAAESVRARDMLQQPQGMPSQTTAKAAPARKVSLFGVLR